MINLHFSVTEGQKKYDLCKVLYTKHRNFMYNIANSVLHDPGEAENAVHDAFVRILENFEKFDLRDGHKTKSLIGIIVKGYAIDAYRRREKMAVVEELPEREDAEAPPDERLIERERYEDLKGHLASLDDIYTEVILLKHSGYSNAEVAALLGVSEDVVRQRLHRARSKLRKRLGTEGEA